MDKKDKKQDNTPGTEPGAAIDPVMDLDETTTPEAEVQDVEDDDSESEEVADLFKKYEETQAALDQKTKDYLYLIDRKSVV